MFCIYENHSHYVVSMISGLHVSCDFCITSGCHIVVINVSSIFVLQIFDIFILVGGSTVQILVVLIQA